ncbi:hypothetical protein ACFLZO_01655, partial [Patescibacteria group bacterium]
MNDDGTFTDSTPFMVTGSGNVGIGVPPAVKLDISTGSNTSGLRFRGPGSFEIADIFVGDTGNLVLSTELGSDTGGYIDLRGEDDQYGTLIRTSAGGSSTTFANLYVTENGTDDYLNIVVSDQQSTTGLVVTETERVGIGTAAPNNTIQVTDLINFDNTYNLTALGYQAGNSTASGNTDNVFVGYQAGYSNTTADANVAIGYRALYTNSTANQNTAVGWKALEANQTGWGNSSLGYGALGSHQSGQANNAFGMGSLASSTTATANNAFGYNALFNATASYNSAFGHMALANNTSGQSNTALGYTALGGTTEGDRNIAIGFQTGGNITTGSDNIIIGANQSAPSATADDQLNIGGTIYGNLNTNRIGINAQTPSASLDVDGSAVFNSAAGNYDFVVRGDTDNSLLFADASTDRIGIGTATPVEKLDVAYGHMRFTEVGGPTTPTVAVNAAAGNLNGTYYYRIAYVTADGETQLSASSTAVSPSNEQVDLSGIPTSSSSAVTARKIFRAKSPSSTSFGYVATISDNTTTTYTDNIADGAVTG